MDECKCEPGIIQVSVLRRHTGDMGSIMFAANYIICQTANNVVHWVHVDRIRRLREKSVRRDVRVLFQSDGLEFEVMNADVIQFLAEVYLAKEIEDEQVK